MYDFVLYYETTPLWLCICPLACRTWFSLSLVYFIFILFILFIFILSFSYPAPSMSWPWAWHGHSHDHDHVILVLSISFWASSWQRAKTLHKCQVWQLDVTLQRQRGALVSGSDPPNFRSIRLGPTKSNPNPNSRRRPYPNPNPRRRPNPNPNPTGSWVGPNLTQVPKGAPSVKPHPGQGQGKAKPRWVSMTTVYNCDCLWLCHAHGYVYIV